MKEQKEQKDKKYKKENEEKIKTNENVVKDEFTVKKDNKKRTSKTFLFISYTIIVILVTLLIKNKIFIKMI